MLHAARCTLPVACPHCAMYKFVRPYLLNIYGERSFSAILSFEFSEFYAFHVLEHGCATSNKMPFLFLQHCNCCCQHSQFEVDFYLIIDYRVIFECS